MQQKELKNSFKKISLYKLHQPIKSDYLLLVIYVGNIEDVNVVS